MIFFTRIRVADQIFAHIENKSADMESAMTFKQGVSGNPHGNRHHTRHLLNQEFMQALLLHFRQHGKKAIEKVAREQPASYLKILGLLVPREHKVEHSNPLKDLTDEQLEAMIEYIETSLAAQAGRSVKLIEGTIEPTALEATAPPALEPPTPFLHSRKGRGGCMERIAIAMQDGGAGAGARAASKPHFVLPPNLYNEPPGRGDFLVSNFHLGPIPGNLA